MRDPASKDRFPLFRQWRAREYTKPCGPRPAMRGCGSRQSVRLYPKYSSILCLHPSKVCIRLLRIHPWTDSSWCCASEYKALQIAIAIKGFSLVVRFKGFTVQELPKVAFWNALLARDLAFLGILV